MTCGGGDGGGGGGGESEERHEWKMNEWERMWEGVRFSNASGNV